MKKKKRRAPKDSCCLTKTEKKRMRKFLYEREGKFLKPSLKKYYFKDECKNNE